MKEQRKDQKKANQIVKELPNAISQHILEGEVKKLELERWRKRMFGV
jgi:DNA-binding HxlR family transcriptional regulator